MQIKPSVTNPTIADIFEKIQSGKLDLRPDFQRKFVWTTEHQEQFIDTILNGYPFPEIYICTGEYDYENLRTSQQVIDGQQRLTTIKNYIEHNYDSNFKFKKIKPFKELSKEDKKNFMSYQLVVRDIGNVEESLIREIFRRINLTKFKLEDIEIHNAIYDGEFIQTAKNILDNIPDGSFNIFHESELTRMADLHFILQILSTIENGGYYNRDKEMERMISEHNDIYAKSSEMISKITDTFKIINSLNLAVSSIWLRKSNFFTLIVELSSFQYDESKKSLLIEKLNSLEENILNNKSSDNDFGKYYSAMYTGTNSRKARIIRADIFKKYILD